MKKVLFATTLLLSTAFGYNAIAQEDVKTTTENKDKKEAQEIIIRKKGDKDAKIIIDISGDKVIINGKPLTEFKDDEISINKRDVIVRNGKSWVGDDDMFPVMAEGFSWDEGEGKSHAFLGVTTETVEKGAKVTDVTEESGASKAGLQEGDIITKINDTKIEGPESLSKAVTAKKPKDEVKVTYLRDGKEKTVKAILQERKSSGYFSFTSPDGSYKTLTMPKMGYADKLRENELQQQLRSIPRTYSYGGGDGYSYSFGYPRQKLGLKIQDTEDGNGVKVLSVDENSAASKAGIKKDDIVTEIGAVKVNNTDEAREQLQENMEKASYNIKAKRNGSEMSFDIKIPKKLKTANL